MSTVRQPGASSSCWRTIIRLNQEWSVNKNRLCCAVTENQQLLHGTQSDNDLCFCSESLCIWLRWPCVLRVPLYVCECVSSFIKGNEVTCYVWTCFDRMPCQMSVLLSVSCHSHDTQTHMWTRTYAHTYTHWRDSFSPPDRGYTISPPIRITWLHLHGWLAEPVSLNHSQLLGCVLYMRDNCAARAARMP